MDAYSARRWPEPRPDDIGRRPRRLAASLLALALISGAQLPGARPAGAQEGQPLPAVVVAAAEVSDIRPRESFSGRLVASNRVEILARVGGFLDEVAFREGARVAEGDVLFRIEDDRYRAAVQEIRGQFGAAEARLRLAEIERDRRQRLVERNTVAQSELDIAVANLGVAESDIVRLEGTLARAELELSYAEVTAPFAGVVGLSNFDVGAFIGPDSGPLTTLTQLDPMNVEFPVTTAELLRFRERVAAGETPGETKVSIVLANGARYGREGEVDFVDVAVNPGTDTVTVRAVFDNPDGILLDGALVNVEIQETEPRLVLNIPRRAIQRDQVGAFVLVVDPEGVVELRRVEVGRSVEGRSVINDGLEEGERVIVEGLNRVRPGIRVDAAEAALPGERRSADD